MDVERHGLGSSLTSTGKGAQTFLHGPCLNVVDSRNGLVFPVRGIRGSYLFRQVLGIDVRVGGRALVGFALCALSLSVKH